MYHKEWRLISLIYIYITHKYRVSFDGSDLTNSVFANAVLSGTTFDNANLKNTDFTDSYLGR